MQYRVTSKTGNTPRAHLMEFSELRRLIRGGAKILDVQEILNRATRPDIE